MRRDVVHAANTGISGIINRRGDVMIRTGWWEETSFRGNINTNDNLTPFARYGDIIGLVAAYLFLPFTVGVIIVQFCRRRRLKH
jgi:apolipoprotein N-acyltransferase